MYFKIVLLILIFLIWGKARNRSLQKIKVQIKSEIARQIWQESGFYYIYNSFDNEFKTALEALK